MLIILFLILLAISLYFTSHFATITSMQKKQIMLLVRQNINLKDKVNNETLILDNVTIFYSVPKYKYGAVSNSCNLYIAPIKKYVILCKLSSNMKLKILDCAKIDNNIWYEVQFQSQDNINNKGWMEAENIIIFENDFIDYKN
ncbi:hypothetical protein [Clostridium sp.]|uniref:hypothetical protein n=1 Tax=Clostridium sp. TaxID=1506 RepID=UPI0025875A77|nr:hypothetical protein [Clostridium sp.]MDF2502938.1 hypothetical protein [Clostridium sp.]